MTTIESTDSGRLGAEGVALMRRRLATLNARAKRDVFDADANVDVFSVLRERMGWTAEHRAEIEDPSYPALKDLDLMVAELHGVRTRGEKIVVLPDFDMDGISAGVLGYAGLAEMGFDVELYVPDYRRGHDLSPDAFQEIHDQFPQATTVITCDGGVNSHAGVLHAKSLGLRVLVTDHHLQLQGVHWADVLVDPDRIDETYPHPAICGAFVLYQVLEAYAAAHVPEKSHAVSMLKLFAGLGTVGDVMPMLYENRKMVRDSLAIARMLVHSLHPSDSATPYEIDKSILVPVLEAGSHHPVYVRAFRGFAYVLRAWREAKSLKTGADLREDFYGFYMAPAFNAIRRIDGEMRVAFDVFVGASDDVQWMSAQTILAYNELRREQTVEWMEELQDRDQPLAPYVWASGAPMGMLGLIAGRLCEEHGVPVVVVHAQSDPASPVGGSARAPSWFPIISTLVPLGYTAVGHEQACGVRAKDAAQMAEIAQVFAEAAERISLEQQALADAGLLPDPFDLLLGVLSPFADRDPDGPMDDPEALLELVSRIEQMRPFGYGFPRPKVRLRVDLSTCGFSLIGEEKDHLRISLDSGTKLLWWNAADRLDALMHRAVSPIPGQTIVEFDVDLSVNNFLGMESAQASVSALVDERGILDD